MRGTEDLRPDQPISLKAACEIIFEDSIGPATLKVEHRRGNLEIFKIGRAYFTTRRHVEAMIEKCRTQVRAAPSRSSGADNLTEEASRRASRAAAWLSVNPAHRVVATAVHTQAESPLSAA